MILQRSERILNELSCRYHLDQEFIEKVRPIVWTILSNEIPEGKRTDLLEFLAETCQRHHSIRTSGNEARMALHEYLQALKQLLEESRNTGLNVSDKHR